MAAAGTHHGGRPTQSAGGGSGIALGGGTTGRSPFDAASGLRTFSGGFQPYQRAAAEQHSAPADGSLKRSISSGRMDGAHCPNLCFPRIQYLLITLPLAVVTLSRCHKALNGSLQTGRAIRQSVGKVTHVLGLILYAITRSNRGCVPAVPPRKRLHAGYWDGGEQQ